MQIVAERIMIPRPLQRPSDLERRPIDFGIEPAAAPPAKPEATIVKSAISRDPEPPLEEPYREPVQSSVKEQQVSIEVIQKIEVIQETVEASTSEVAGDDWGEGIL